MDTEALESMGYEFVEGETAGKGKDEAVAGQFFAYAFKDTLLPDGRNTVDYWSAKYDEQGREIKDPVYPDPYFNLMNAPITLKFTDSNQNSYEREIQITGRVKEDYGKGYETSQGLMISIDTLKDIISKITGLPPGKTEYTSMSVKATDINTVGDVESEIKAMGYNTYSMASMREEMQKSARQMQLMLGGLGAISLFVAAIGITQRDDYVYFRANQGNRHYEIARLLCKRYTCAFPDGSRYNRTFGRNCRQCFQFPDIVGNQHCLYRHGLYERSSAAGDLWWRRCQPNFGNSGMAGSVCNRIFNFYRPRFGLLSGK